MELEGRHPFVLSQNGWKGNEANNSLEPPTSKINNTLNRSELFWPLAHNPELTCLEIEVILKHLKGLKNNLNNKHATLFTPQQDKISRNDH